VYYVYVYIDPRDHVPFYVGKGSNNRAWDHLRETSKTTENIAKYQKIQSIRNAGMEPIVEFAYENIHDENEAYLLEDELIQHYGRTQLDHDGVLTNVCLGNKPPKNVGKNNGMYGRHRTDSEKQAVSIANKGKIPWNKGKKRTEEEKQAMRDGIKRANPSGRKVWNEGKERSKEDKQRISNGIKQHNPNGRIPWNKGLKTGPLSTEHKQSLSASKKGQIPWNKGKTYKKK